MEAAEPGRRPQSLERLEESACNLEGRGVHYEDDSNDPGGVF